MNASKRHLLKIRAIISAWLQAREHELSGDVLGGQLPAAPARSAPFELVARKKLHMGTNSLWRNIGLLGLKTPQPYKAKGQEATINQHNSGYFELSTFGITSISMEIGIFVLL